MHRDAAAEAGIAFGPFRLFPSARLLERDGVPVQIGGRALDILMCLVERAGDVVSKRDLVSRVWSDVTVDEGSLRFHITVLRRALGDGKAGARYVMNVPGRGYCLVVPTSRSTSGDASLQEAKAPSLPPSLPPRLARMVGRDATVQKLTDELSKHRFVTVVGPGGIGKTTVATAAAHALSPTFDGRVSFVDLGPLGDARLVPTAVASTLGLMVNSEDPTASLIASLQDRPILMVLDSCEHVIETASALAERIVQAAPVVHILATSRESLRVEGEHVHRLFPLSYPSQGEDLSASDVLGFPAVQLFIERVTASSGRFDLTDTDAPAVAEICRRLDGIPLALELAAAGADVFGLMGLAARLDRLLLATQGRRTALPRHQTLRATLDWSYDRLPEPEQLLLNRLSIFSGAFSFAAASAVCPGHTLSEANIPDGIAELVAKSLVARISGMEASYRLLDTTRYYASDKLEVSGERDAFAARHARYICTLFESAAKQWEERPSIEWLASYRPQIDNLRAALKWAFSDSGDPALGVALTIAAVPLWSQLSLVDEFLDWVDCALAISARLPDKNRRGEMQLYAAIGGLQMYAISRVKQANGAWETALTLATELGETDYQLRALRALWAESVNSGGFRRALLLAERFQELALQTDRIDDQVVSDRLIGTALHFLGEQEKAEAATERMLERYVASAARAQVVRYQFNQKISARIIRGRILWLQGRAESALRDIEENVAEALELDHAMSLCNVLTQAACPVAILAAEFDTAQRYVDLLREHTASRALDIWHAYAVCFDAALDIERGQIQRGLHRLQPAMEELRRSGFGHYRTSFLMMRAQSLLLLDRPSDADAAVAEAMTICEGTGERWCLPELHRLAGEIRLRQHGGAGTEAAVISFHRALSLAREQPALAWELRAATSLVHCLADDRRLDEARTALKQIYAQFTEGHDRPELVAAAALIG